jgi:hemolysin activation/secretion protein
MCKVVIFFCYEQYFFPRKLMRRCFFLLSFLLSALSADEPAPQQELSPSSAPPLTQQESVLQNNETLQDGELATIFPMNSEYVLLRGILITTDEQKAFTSFSGVHFEKIQIPGKQKQLEKILSSHLGEPITKDLLKIIKEEIIAYYRSQRHPLVIVLVPSQDVSQGVLQVLTLEGKVGKIVVKGSKWTKEERIRKEIRFGPNDVIDEKLLEQDLYWLNRQPFRQAYIVYAPGEKVGTTDVEVVIKDRMPYRGYVGTDNLGNDVTGNIRLFAGLNIGNLFGNQLFSYQFTTDHECKKFIAHSAFYKAPLPWRHDLILFGGYSHVDAKYRVGNNPFLFHSKGFSAQASLRYDIPLPPWKNILSEVSFGGDFKRTNNSLAYGVISLFPGGHFANLTQIMASFNIGYTKSMTVSFEIEGFWSPGKWISDQDNAQYDSIRYGARSRYLYARSSFTLIYPFKDWNWKHYLRWQLSNRNLLPSEEYGLGGFDTIRGYKEREINVDDAIVYNMELHAPLIKVLSRREGKKNLTDHIDFFVFGDVGYGVKNRSAPGEKKDYFLASVGPGARYNIVPYLAAKAEWGYQLNYLGASGFNGPHQRLHFSLIAGF